MLALIVLLSCNKNKEAPSTEDSPPEGEWTPSLEPYPAQCTDSSWENRFTEQAAEYGLVEPIGGITEICEVCAPRGGGLVAQDFDDDGYIDVVIGNIWLEPTLYQGQADGHFQSEPLEPVSLDLFPIPQKDQVIWNIATADIDSDGDWDLLFSSSGAAGYYQNNDGKLGTPQLLYTESPTGAVGIFSTISTGDINADGRIDILLTSTRGLACHNCEGETPSNPDGSDAVNKWKDVLLVQQTDGSFQNIDLYSDDDGSNSHIGVFTDLDMDGDADMYIPKDIEGSVAFWENKGTSNAGTPSLENTAPEWAIDIDCHGMGYDVADLNADGLLDFCVSCIGLPFCLINDGFGQFYDASRTLGFSINSYSSQQPNVGWSAWLHDYNNDGHIDYAMANGETDGERDQYDLIWAGTENGLFHERTFEMGIEDIRNNYGMISYDFSGDGYLDLLIAGPKHQPMLWINKGGDCSWLEVEVPIHITNAFIEVEASGQRHLKETLHNSGQAQNPNVFHFGLQNAEMIDSVRLIWKGEVIKEYNNIGAGQRVHF